MSQRYYLGVDVGTTSARAAVFDATGVRAGLASHPIRIERPRQDHVEHSSEDIWSAVCSSVQAAVAQAGIAAAQVAGIGFDATCSLVALDDGDRPVSLSTTADDALNVIVWMDHRALEQAAFINETGHEVLRYVGGAISPEMQTPKLLWLKQELPEAFQRSARFFDLPDFLTYRATGSDVRSLCSTTCKWTYLEKAGGFQDDFFELVGLGELAQERYQRIGQQVEPMGKRIAGLSERSAAELGLCPGTAVAVSIIDAHAGGLGVLGAVVDTAGGEQGEEPLERRLALIGGTSSCHMAVSHEPRYPSGIWGPYFSAMVPDMWLTEGGQSATGALIDHVIDSHARGAELGAVAERRGTTRYALLNERLEALAEGQGSAARLTRELHVLPYFHGNRSPRADPTLRGMISGLKLDDGVDALAVLYLATIQAIAHGTRHIIDTMNGAGFAIETVMACGGDIKNPVFVREHADITGCRLVLPKETEAVLLGAALLGAVASGDQPSVAAAMAAMNRAGTVVEPARGEVADYHERKHRVFHQMYEDQQRHKRMIGPE